MKLKFYLLITVLFCIAVSCDTTDIDPKDSITDETFWKNPEDLKLYANQFYENLKAPSVHLDDRSDNNITSNYNNYLFNEYIIPTTSDPENDLWDWETIRACNFFMTHYEEVEGTEENINQFVAEVRFFRADDYFKKIKKYGDVPYYDEDITVSDEEMLYKERDSRDFVLSKIIEDLNFAIKWLPEPGSVEEGRIHKYAAMTALAEVSLNEGTYKKYHNDISSDGISADVLFRMASENAEGVMNSGLYNIVVGNDSDTGQLHFDGYPLNYSNQFIQESLSNNRECILARNYKLDVLMHQTGRQATEAMVGYSKDFVETFLCIDGQPIATSPLYKGDDTVEKEIENRDPRLYQVIDNKHKPYLVIDGERQVNPYTNVSPARAVTGYQMVKFKSPLIRQSEANRSTFDWFVYRYAEVLLIEAEAKAELGECTQDVLDNTINKLRDRVDMPHLNLTPMQDPNAVDYGYSITPLLYEIRRERRIELADEGFRWDDIIRWKGGNLLANPKTFLGMRVTPEVLKLYPEGTFYGSNGVETINYQGKDLIRPYTGKALNDQGRQWSINDKRYLEPIPLQELSLNSNLEQNPSW